MATAARPPQSRWSSGAFRARELAPLPATPTLFEQEVTKCGLAAHPECWVNSVCLRAFAKANRNRRYIPEWYLEELGLLVSEHEVDAA